MTFGTTALKVLVAAAVMAIAYLLDVVWPLLAWRAKLKKAAAEDLMPSPGEPSPEISEPLSETNEELTTADENLPKTDELAVEADQSPRRRPEDVVTGDSSKKTPVSVNPEAQRSWEEAEAVACAANADLSTNWRYVALLQNAASLGHPMAMSALGDCALANEQPVEAFYWKWLVEAHGGVCVNPSLDDLVQICRNTGALTEPGTPNGVYTADADDFARALIALRCCMDVDSAWDRIHELADAGHAAAKLVLEDPTLA